MAVQRAPVRISQPRFPVQSEMESTFVSAVDSPAEPDIDYQVARPSRSVVAPTHLPLLPERPTYVLLPPKKPLPRQRFVPTLLIISCLIFLVASSLLAYIFIQRKPVADKQVLTVLPNVVRTHDTFTLSGSGFGTNDLISFHHDQHNDSMLNGNGKPLQTYADDQGMFSVPAVVPTNWGVGQHAIYAIDIGKEQSVSVLAMLTVQQPPSTPPLLQLSTTSLDLGTNAPGAISKKDITLINAGGGQVNWQASSDQPWLTVFPTSGTFSGRTITQVTTNPGALKPQSYAGKIKFRQQGSNQTLLLTVTMTVEAAPPELLTVAPVALTYSATANQNPSNQTITLQNAGSQPLDWSSDIGNSAAWLSINPSSDHLVAHGSETLAVSVSPQQLAVGSYQGTINFKGGGNLQVTVALNIAAPGNLVVSPSSLSFSSLGQNPTSQTLAVQNSGGQSLQWTLAVATVDGANWLNAAPSSGQLGPNQTANVTVNVNASALKPRSYQGMLTFSYNGATSQVAVSLTVSVPPLATISLNQSTLDFTTIKGTNPSSQTFTITNTGNATLNWIITEDQNGRSFAPPSATSGSLAPTKSTMITVAPSVLQANGGVLATNITVLDSDSGTKVSDQKIAVTIVVKDQPAMALSVNSMTFNHNSTVTDSSLPLVITNTGSQPLNWVANSSDTWLSADTLSGTLSPGASITINVSCMSSALAPGTFTATIVINDSDAGTPVTPQTLSVILGVS